MTYALKQLKQFKPILFVLPALFFYVVFLIIPIFKTFQFSFYSWNGISPVMKFVGLDNFIKLIHDAIFWRALGHNIIWIIATLILPLLLGLILASFLAEKGIKGKLIFRTAYFMPVIVAPVAVGIVWNWIYHPDFGIVNTFLQTIGLEAVAQPWLGNESTVLPALIITGSWTYYGFCLVIFLAALQGIDKSYYEAAKVEGANPIQTFFYITVPLLKNTTTLLIIYSLIGSFKVFDIIYIMTHGGPYHSSEVIGTYAYSLAFEMNQVGYGSAVSAVLALIIALCSVIYIRIAEKD